MAAYRRAFQLNPQDRLLESKLGYTEVKLGHKKTGLTKLRRAAKAVTDVHAVHDRLMKGCIMAGRLEEAAEVAEQFTRVMGYPKLFLRAASIRAQLKQWSQAEQGLCRGLHLFPESLELRSALEEVASRKLETAEKATTDVPVR
jgi:tetratricopeptide (TPR) repeat protein